MLGVPAQLYSLTMLKVELSVSKNSPFFQKFKGRVSKVPRLGINAVLLREEFEQEWAVRVGPNARLPLCPPNCLAKDPSVQLFRACPQPSLQLRPKDPAQPDPDPERKILQRNPSERLPLIHRSGESGRESRAGSRLREKMKSEQHRKESEISRKDSAGGEKYKVWKYPPRLSQKALRFFAFAERELATGQKSARI